MKQHDNQSLSSFFHLMRSPKQGVGFQFGSEGCTVAATETKITYKRETKNQG